MRKAPEPIPNRLADCRRPRARLLAQRESIPVPYLDSSDSGWAGSHLSQQVWQGRDSELIHWASLPPPQRHT